jgi:hypothetical protein
MTARRRRLLIAVFALQAAVLLSTVALQGARVASGTRVLLATTPVDPLDLARGAYVDLEYELEQQSVPAGTPPGEVVYVGLRRPDDGTTETWSATSVATDPNRLGDVDAFIRLQAGRDGRVDAAEISTYYASADRAIALERQLVDGGVAEVSLQSDGRPTLVEVRGASGIRSAATG